MKYLVCLLVVLASASTTAGDTSNLVPTKGSQGIWYYEIGGAEYLRIPKIQRTSFRPGAYLRWNSNLMCSNLDPEISWDAFMNGAKRGWVQMQRNAISTVRSTIASLPGLALQHADAGLYEMVSTGFIQAENLFQIEIANCRKITSDLAEGKPMNEWVKVSGMQSLQDMFSSSGTPKTNISKDMGLFVEEQEEDVGKEGIEWVFGSKAGGAGQDPIVSSDVLVATYNRIIGRSLNDTSSVRSSPSTPVYAKYWSSPTEAKRWLTEVVGESVVRTDPSDKPLSRSAGIGLMAMVEKTKEDVHFRLVSIVSAPDTPTLEELRSVSFNGVLVTKEMIQALRTDPDRGVLISRLSTDIAMQREIMKALEIRRLLVIGSDDEIVAANGPSKAMIKEYIDRLSLEIKMVREEKEIREELVSSTAPYILKRDVQRRRELVGDIKEATQSAGER